MDDLKLAVSFIALIVATVALIRQRRSTQQQARRELSRCHNEAELLQEQLLLRIEFLIYKYLRLKERIAALLTKRTDSTDKSWLEEQTYRIESRLQDLHRNRTGGHDSLMRLRDKNFAKNKDLIYFDKLCETLRASLSAIDDGGVKGLIGDLEDDVAQIEQKLL